MDNARDVIARGMVDHEAPKGVWNAYVASYPIYKERADAIIGALNAAGYEIVQRDAPIQKPEPDWGRRGTQPKGKLGPPPPPNGKRVASKPLPPTPGPFNPFGKQDGE